MHDVEFSERYVYDSSTCAKRFLCKTFWNLNNSPKRPCIINNTYVQPIALGHVTILQINGTSITTISKTDPIQCNYQNQANPSHQIQPLFHRLTLMGLKDDGVGSGPG